MVYGGGNTTTTTVPPPSTSSSSPHPPPPRPNPAGSDLDLRQQLAYLQTRESRLLHALHSLGHPSLDSLEDFIFLHGASKVVPVASSTITTDTQASESHPPRSPSKRDARHRQRKVELAHAREDQAVLRAELDQAKLELAREKDLREQKERDLEILLRSDARDSSTGDDPEEWDEERLELRDQLELYYDEVIELQTNEAAYLQEIDRLKTEQDEMRQEIDSLHRKCDAEGVARRDVETRLENEVEKVKKLEKEVKGLRIHASPRASKPPSILPQSSPKRSAPHAPSPDILHLRGPPPPSVSPRTASKARAPSSLPIPGLVDPFLAPVPASTPTITSEQSSSPSNEPAPLTPLATTERPDPSLAATLRSAQRQEEYYEGLRQSYDDLRNTHAKWKTWCNTKLHDFLTSNPSLRPGDGQLPLLPPDHDPPVYPALDEVLARGNLGTTYLELEQWQRTLEQTAAKARAFRAAVQALSASVKVVDIKKKRKVDKGKGKSVDDSTPATTPALTRSSRDSAILPRKHATSPTSPGSVHLNDLLLASAPYQPALGSAVPGPATAIVVHPSSRSSTHPLGPTPQETILSQTPKKRKRKSDIFSLSSSAKRTASRARTTTSPVKPTGAPPLTRQEIATIIFAPANPVASMDRTERNPLPQPISPTIAAAPSAPLFPLSPHRADQPPHGQHATALPESSWEPEPDTLPDDLDFAAHPVVAMAAAPPSTAHRRNTSSPRKRRSSTSGPDPSIARSHRPLSPLKTEFVNPAATSITPDAGSRSQDPWSSPPLLSRSILRRSSTSTRPLQLPSVSPAVVAELEDVKPPRPNTIVSPFRPQAADLESSVHSKRKTRASSSPRRRIKPDPSPPPVALARERSPLRLRAAMGSPPLPAADWKAMERQRLGTPRDGNGRKKRRRDSPSGDSEDDEQKQEQLKGKRKKVKVKVATASKAGTSDLAAIDQGPTSDDAGGRRYIAMIQAKRRGEAEKIRKAAAAKAAERAAGPALEINPARNAGQDFHFKETVRKKDERSRMKAGMCDQCTEYYKVAHAGFDAPPKACQHGPTKQQPKNSYLDERHKEMSDRLQKTSRHRQYARVEPDPPDYWQLGMPGTQRVDDINRRAGEQREEKRMYQEAEAIDGGFYRFRNDQTHEH